MKVETNVATHTPGPWRVEDVTEVIATLPTGEKLSICLTADVELWDDYRGGKNAANARLIAASPSLLAACEARLDKSRMTREAFLAKYNLVEGSDPETFCDGLELGAVAKAKGA